MKYARSLLILSLVFCGCEPFYDPVITKDIPTSPGSKWERVPIKVKKTADVPFDASNLSKEMTLTDLLDMALYNNPETRMSWSASKAAAFGWRASLSAYYPSLGYVGTLSAQTNRGSSFASSGSGIVSSNTSTATDATVSRLTSQTDNVALTYLLLDFGARSANAESAFQTLISANWQHDLTMQQVMLTTLNAYTAYLGNQALVIANAQDLKDAETALQAAKVMKEAGLATKTDLLLAQSNVELAKTSLIQSRGAEKISLSQLLTAVGLPPDTVINVKELPQELPVIEISGDISSLIELAKTKRPDLGIAIAAIKQQEAALAFAYSTSMPILTANADWNQVRFISPKKAPGINENAFLQLSFPIFQGYYYMNQQRQLRSQVEEALANLDVQVAAVALQVATNFYAFHSAESALPSSEAAVVYSQRAYKGLVLQYKTGTASILDVLNALTTLSNARSQQVLTRTNWATSLANLAFSVGILDRDSGGWKKGPPKQLTQLPIRGDNENL